MAEPAARPSFPHQPVLVEEVLAALEAGPGDFVVDATVGAGGHAAALLQRLMPGGFLVGLDRDPAALAVAAGRLAPFAGSFRLARGPFAELDRLAADAGGRRPAAILFDLGVSSLQLDDPARGFSFRGEGPLDMRQDPAQATTAADLVNRLPERELADLLFRLGGERRARAVARRLAGQRRRRPFASTGELAAAVREAVGGRGRIDAATRTFQALRLAVNDELGQLAAALPRAAAWLAPGGRLAVIAFHSLEDRLVKQFLRHEARAGRLVSGTKKPLRPGRAEIAANPRSRSARLRWAVKNAEENLERAGGDGR